MMVSYLFKMSGFKKQGDDLRKYVYFDIAKQIRSKYRAECLSIFNRRPAINSKSSNLALRTHWVSEIRTYEFLDILIGFIIRFCVPTLLCGHNMQSCRSFLLQKNQQSNLKCIDSCRLFGMYKNKHFRA